MTATSFSRAVARTAANALLTFLVLACLAVPGRAHTASPAAGRAFLAIQSTSRIDSVPTLEPNDLAAWLDGYLSFALPRGDLAGAVVVVVRGGTVVHARGYGYADVAARKPIDPNRTLFRPGSVSKLFTAIAVMQLVEEGKLELDKDVNSYLDFRIPPQDGKPITVRHLLTHTPGFEEVLKDLLVFDPAALVPLANL